MCVFFLLVHRLTKRQVCDRQIYENINFVVNFDSSFIDLFHGAELISPVWDLDIGV